MLNLILVLMTLINGTADKAKSIYDYSFKTIDGQTVNFSSFKGKKLLIVNTASKCGYTKQYADLEKLHELYGDKVVLIAFPSGNFGGQEFEDNAQIKTFCTSTFNTSFTIAEKTEVKGAAISDLFKFLTTSENPDFTGEIKWNFEKFLINEEGKLVHRYRSAVNPLDNSITKNF